MMKKTVITAIVTLLLLAGCGNKAANVSDANQSVVTIGDTEVTRGELYNYMSSYTSSAVYLRLKKLIVDDKIKDTDELTKQARESLEEEKSVLGDKFLDTLKQMGYKDEEDYYQNAVLLSLKNDELVKKYINDNIENFTQQYTPYKIRVMQIADETKANEALEEVKNGKNFGEVATAYSSASYKGAEEIWINTNTSLPTAVTDIIKSQTAPTLIQEPIHDSAGGYYYIVQIIATDVTRFQDEFVNTIKGVQGLADKMYAQYAREGNFKVYDINILADLKQSYPDLFTEGE